MTIHWLQLPPLSPIIDAGMCYKTEDGKLIVWHGNEALKAQQSLAARVIRQNKIREFQKNSLDK